MIEIHFHRDLYGAPAVAEAAKVYGAYGTVDVVEGETGWLARVTSSAEGVDDRALAAELSNYALGMTVDLARAEDQAPAEEARP